jgi:hypothetical protein
MNFGIEMAAIAALPFAAAMGVGTGLASLDLATRGYVGWVMVLVLEVALIGAMLAFLTQTLHADFPTEVLALAPITAMLGLLLGYGLGKAAKAKTAARAVSAGHRR